MNPSEPSALATYVRRIYSEYLEMPGMRLTSAQAQRLWGLEQHACDEALGTLIEAGFLRRTEYGEYVRLTDGAVGTRPLRMAKADIARTPGGRLAV